MFWFSNLFQLFFLFLSHLPFVYIKLCIAFFFLESAWCNEIFFLGRTTFSAEKNAYERLITSVGYTIYTWMYLTGTWFERLPLFSFCLFILFAKNLIRETGLSRPADGCIQTLRTLNSKTHSFSSTDRKNWIRS